MALYNRDPLSDKILDLFSDEDFGFLLGGGEGGSTHLSYSTSVSRGINSTSGSSRTPQHNALELGARRLPRPKRRRKKRKPEVSLYPSLSAIEDCIPDTAALDFGVSTSDGPCSSRINTRSSPSDNNDTNSCCSSSSLASSCSSVSGLLRHPSKSYSRKVHDNDDDLASLVAPRRSACSEPRSSSRHYSNQSSSLSIASFANRSVGSSSSGGSGELERDFKRISLTSNKRRPASRGGSVNAEEAICQDEAEPFSLQQRETASRVPEAPGGSGLLNYDSRTKKDEKFYKSRSNYSSGSSQESEKTSKYSSSQGDVLCKQRNDGSSHGSEKSYKGYSPYTPYDTRSSTSGSGSDEKSYCKSYKSYSGNKGPSTFGSLIRSVRDDYMENEEEQPLPREEAAPVPAGKRVQHLEIEPGLLLPLRGAEETVTSIKAGFVESVYCQACEIELLCIADANFCVCPECKCISPVSTSIAANTDTHTLYPAGSVGLGFRRNHRVAANSR